MPKRHGAKIGKEAPVSKKTRSCGYPLFALPQAIEAARALSDRLGEGPHSRETAARGLGYSSFSGAASGKIGSLVHFGMLARSGGMYTITPQAKFAFAYPEEGSGEAIAALAGNPVLYRKLIARFLNKSLPEKLETILASDYGITGKAAPVAARNFVETLEFAGLIREGRLVFSEPDGVAAAIGRPAAQKKENDIFVPGIKIKLTSGIEILFPQELAYRLSMGEFAQPIKELDGKALGDGYLIRH